MRKVLAGIARSKQKKNVYEEVYLSQGRIRQEENTNHYHTIHIVHGVFLVIHGKMVSHSTTSSSPFLRRLTADLKWKVYNAKAR